MSAGAIGVLKTALRAAAVHSPHNKRLQLALIDELATRYAEMNEDAKANAYLARASKMLLELFHDAYRASKFEEMNNVLGDNLAIIGLLSRVLPAVEQEDDRALHFKVLAQLANAYLEQGQASQAVVLFRAAAGIAEALNDRSMLFESNFGLGKAHQAMGDARTAVLLLLHSADLLPPELRPTSYVDILDRAACAHMELGDLDAAAKTLERAIEYARSLALPLEVLLNRIAVVHRNAKNYAAAVRAYEEVTAIAQRKRSVLLEGYTALNMAEILAETDDVQEALKFFSISNHLLRDLDKYARCVTLYRMGELSWKLRDNELAMQFFSQCATFAAGLENFHLAGYCHMNIGRVFIASRDFATAMSHFEGQALPFLTKCGDEHGRALCLMQIVQCLRNLGNNERAAQFALQAKHAAEKGRNAAVLEICNKFIELHKLRTTAATGVRT